MARLILLVGAVLLAACTRHPAAPASRGHRLVAGEVLALRASADGAYLASGSEDHTFRIWDTRANKSQEVKTEPDSVEATCLIRPPIDNALAVGVSRACSSVRACAVNLRKYRWVCRASIRS